MRKANPKAVGGFVVGALILIIVAVMVFGSGRFFKETSTVVAFFPDSLLGLRIGAPVEIRGVQIGTVTDIWVGIDPDQLNFLIPVIMEIEPSRIRGSDALEARGTDFEDLIKKGFRAELVSRSFVTGQKSIALGFYPGTPVRLVKTRLSHTQIPTVQSKVARIERTFGDVVNDAENMLTQISGYLSEKNRINIEQTFENIANITTELHSNADNFTGILSELSEILRSIKADMPRLRALLEDGGKTLESYRSLANSAKKVVTENQPGIREAVDGLARVEVKLGALSDATKKLIDDNQEGLTEFSNKGLYEISNFAVDAQAAVEQFRRVMEEMERDPARFFLGKTGQVEVE
jgi:paraquat-inducible protein B